MGVAFVCVFVVSYAIFFLIKETIGLRVTAEEEDAGLDISEHGMYGYPEQFIPQPEYSTGAPRTHAAAGSNPGPGGLDPDGQTSPRRHERMKKIEAYIRHEAFEPIRAELLDKGFPSLSIIEAKGSGRQKGIVERYRGSTLTVNVRPKIKLEVVIEDKDKDVVVETILKHARTGEVGDGKIFVLPVEEAIRIRTGEDGQSVLQLHEESEIPT